MKCRAESFAKILSFYAIKLNEQRPQLTPMIMFYDEHLNQNFIAAEQENQTHSSHWNDNDDSDDRWM